MQARNLVSSGTSSDAPHWLQVSFNGIMAILAETVLSLTPPPTVALSPAVVLGKEADPRSVVLSYLLLDETDNATN